MEKLKFVYDERSFEMDVFVTRMQSKKNVRRVISAYYANFRKSGDNYSFRSVQVHEQKHQFF